MSDLEIAKRLKSGKEFDVPDERCRKRALEAAKFLGVQIITRSNDKGGFTVKFIK